MFLGLLFRRPGERERHSLFPPLDRVERLAGKATRGSVVDARRQDGQGSSRAEAHPEGLRETEDGFHKGCDQTPGYPCQGRTPGRSLLLSLRLLAQLSADAPSQGCGRLGQLGWLKSQRKPQQGLQLITRLRMGRKEVLHRATPCPNLCQGPRENILRLPYHLST